MAADDFDIVIEAMLEEPYKNQEDESQKNEEKHDAESSSHSKDRSSRSKERSSRSHSRNRRRGSRSRSREHRHRSRSRDRRRRSRSRERRHRSRSREHCHSHTRDRHPIHSQRHRSPVRRPTPSIGRSPRHFEKSPIREPLNNLSPEERDARTVFCMQLAARIRPRDLEDFFSAVGKVRDVRIIADRNSRRSKGIAYVEFCEIQSVPLAIGLTGQRLLGVPIIVQASQAEKNRLAALANNMQRFSTGPLKLYVGSLHCNITEIMLRGIFEPFGKIENIQIMRVPETRVSKGFGFLTFAEAESARRALEQLNGFELAGQPIRVGYVTDRLDGGCDISFPDSDEAERAKALEVARIQLMAKLAEGSGMQLPLMAQAALQLNGAIPLSSFTAMNPALNLTSAAMASQCVQLSNVFHSQSM
ncbi:probable RNA-binding protein 23 isoform X2 [Ambystoma mexicanum]|uniref:probable RNA-binding protein 23 isoform X2 n=1 Tax=Ambystoma mexicanum TaxID=8296 RepID=UPI0037E7B08B